MPRCRWIMHLQMISSYHYLIKLLKHSNTHFWQCFKIQRIVFKTLVIAFKWPYFNSWQSLFPRILKNSNTIYSTKTSSFNSFFVLGLNSSMTCFTFSYTPLINSWPILTWKRLEACKQCLQTCLQSNLMKKNLISYKG